MTSQLAEVLSAKVAAGAKVFVLIASENVTVTPATAPGWLKGVTGPNCTMAGGVVLVEP